MDNLASQKRKWIVLLTTLFSIIALSYLTRGFAIYFLGGATGPGSLGGTDARNRWIEQQYILRGKNPYDVVFAHEAEDSSIPNRHLDSGESRDVNIDTDLGIPPQVGYPPWTYFTGAILLWPGSMETAHRYYALWMVVSLVSVAAWSMSVGRRVAPNAQLCFFAASLAMGSWVGAIYSGNFTTLVVALLAGALVSAQDKRPWLAGLCLGAAMIKPTLAGPFIVPFLVRREYKAVGTAAAYLVVGSTFVWFATGTNPVEMLGQMLTVGKRYVGEGVGLVQWLIWHGVKPLVATAVMAPLVGSIGIVLSLIYRREPLIVHFAVAAVVARFWSYHLYFDDAILLFLTVALVSEAIEERTRFLEFVSLLCVISLAAPARAMRLYGFVEFQQVVWVLGLVSLLLMRSRMTGAVLSGRVRRT